MAQYGTAPRKINGVWVTRSGRKLTSAQSAIWDRYVAQGRFDMYGHRVYRSASATQIPKETPPSVGSFKGSVQDRQKLATYLKHKKMAVAAAAAAQDIPGHELLPQAEHAYKTINPTVAKVIESVSPGPGVVKAAGLIGHGKVAQGLVTGGLATASIFPGFKAAKAGEEIVKAAEAAKTVRTVKNVAKAAAKAEPTLGKKAVSQPLTMQQAVAQAFETPGERAAFHQARLIAYEKGKRLVEAKKAYGVAGEGSAGHEAFKQELAGPYSKVPFNNLTHLTQDQVSELTKAAYNHPELTDLEALGLGEAIKRANKGLPPRPFEIALVHKAFGGEKAAEYAQGRSVAEAISNVANIPRAIMSSFDVSAPFRQGLMGFAMYPGQSSKALPGMFKSLASEARYQVRQKNLVRKPLYNRSVEAGVNYSHLSESIFGREEQFASQAAERVTGLGPLVGKKPGTGSFVRASGRAYTDFLDHQRYNIYSTLTKEAARHGETDTPKLDHDIARITNWATGRGDMTHKNIAVLANTFLFSPRLFKSRLDAVGVTDLANLVIPGKHGFYSDLHPFARRKALKSLVKLVATGTGVLAAMSRISGVDVGLDPRSSDFGKIRIGKTRYDIWGGYQQEARTIAQLASQTVKSSTTGETTHLGRGHHLDPLVRLMQGKLSPPISTAVAFKQGQEFAGHPFSWKVEAQQKLTPLLLQDVYDAWRSGMSPFGVAATFGIGSLGVGTQTYSSQKPSRHPGTGQFNRPGSLPDLSQVGIEQGHGGLPDLSQIAPLQGH